MSKTTAHNVIRLRGVRHNNLKGFDLDLPLRQLVVITGLSGSGKSSLAFDTLFAEGQRRYIETFSPYARQFFDRMDKPRVDSIEGIPPAIAIEQRNSVKTTRSTVGTMTEICDYLKLLWPHVSRLYCKQCEREVRKDPPQNIWTELGKAETAPAPAEVLLTFALPLAEKLSLEESLGLVAKQGYQRILIGDEVVRVEEAAAQLAGASASSLTIVQDRLKLAPASRARFIEACEQAYHFGKGKLTLVSLVDGRPTGARRRFSNRLHCAECDLDYREPSPALFSFNHPVGACPACRGFGRTVTIDYNLAVPDRSLSLAGGLVKPWQSGHGVESQRDLTRFCKTRKVRMDVPFQELPKSVQDWVINGDPGYGQDAAHEWPKAWYGVKGYFRWLESKSYKMHYRILLARYRSYQTCPECKGARFQPEALWHRLPVEPGWLPATGAAATTITLADFYSLPIRSAHHLVQQLKTARRPKPNDPLDLAINEVLARLGYLVEVGLGYITLDRPTRTLSGGETERVNLTTCLGSRLVNTLFVLDEPSVGLHPRDTGRLIKILERLRNAGNTVVVVEHESSVMRAADQIVDLGPGHGESGGQLVFQGSYPEILKAGQSLTGQYLAGTKSIPLPVRRPVDSCADAFLVAERLTLHNLQNLTVRIPLQRLVCVTGVSGSGKTTLAREVLLPALAARLKGQPAEGAAGVEGEADNENDSPDSASLPQAELRGWEQIGQVVLVDQSPLGKTPRSNPAVYIGAFEDIREVYAASEPAKQRGLNASAFSFNSAQGQCERCRGAGFEKIEMQFLSDVFIRCPDCNGRRYRPHILEIKLAPGAGAAENTGTAWSIADLLEATVEDAVTFLATFTESRPARRALASLRWLLEVGLGYLRLGQPINTLSGGESQRLKLVSHLAECDAPAKTPPDASAKTPAPSRAKKSALVKDPGPARPAHTLFLFDEPTTGLHFDDVRVLLQVFQRLVNAGHSVLVVEHNLDVIKSADWLIDLGPDAGDEGGRIVVEGTPEEVAECAASHTGQALHSVLSTRTKPA